MEKSIEKITEFEKALLENLGLNWHWIARDSDGDQESVIYFKYTKMII